MSSPLPVLPPSVAHLAPFVAAGQFGVGEVHVAATVARLAPGTDPSVLLAVAVAARAPRLGHVGIELHAVAERLLDGRVDEPLTLPWPDLGAWTAALDASAVVARPEEADREPLAPLVWDGHRLYLQRYWAYELLVAAEVGARAGGPAERLAGSLGTADLDRLFPAGPGDGPDLQRQAAEVALAGRLSVVAGGPGTGKTRTVARLLAAALVAAAAAGRSVEVALAAPTGKAAARMLEAVRQAVAEARAEGAISEGVAEQLLAVEASTIHALLGWVPGVRFRHDRLDPLPHDLVVVDEASMVSLPLMARLLQAVRPDASLVLVGDPDQLASVDAGTVLADLVGPRPPAPAVVPDQVDGPTPAAAGRRRRVAPDPDAPRLFDLAEVEEPPIPDATALAAAAAPAGMPTGPLTGLVTVLERVHRFGADSGIAALADAVRRGEADRALALLDGSRADLTWVRADDLVGVAGVEAAVVAAALDVTNAARSGDASAGLAAAHRVKVLAATRLGDGGLHDWTGRVERAVRAAVPDLPVGARWYAGRPVLVTANDRVNRLANGDTGLIVARDDSTVVALPEGEGVRFVPASRLHEVETWWAMTIHKSQGSEFPHVVVSLPGPRSPILTRELLYTAITRARERVTIVAGEDALRLAIGRPVARASGLGARLWHD